MQKDQAYHEAAILYNEGLAEFAETLAPKLKHEVVQKWCVGVGKQHRFHAKRHRSALNKILLKQKPDIVESIADGLDVQNEPEIGVETVVVDEPVEMRVSTSSVDEVTEILEPQEGPKLEDGCIQFHNPSDSKCEFYPKES